MNKIVFLDAYTLQTKELDINILEEYGNLKVYNRTLPSQILERAKDANILLTNKTPINKDTIDQLPHLKYIGVTATGYNCVDIVAAKERNIMVCNAAGYSTASVAQQTFAMILSFANRLSEHQNPQVWASQPDFCYYNFTITELSGLTLGLIGYGEIAKEVAKIANAFGMKVLFNKPSIILNPPFNAVQTDLDDLLKKSDFVSLHCPLNSSNGQIINAVTLSKMKRSAILINTARGGLINEQDLAVALKNGIIAGAYLDVLGVEPPSSDHTLFGIPTCKFSPHLAWASLAARQRLLKIVYKNIGCYLKGKPENVVV